MLLRDKYDWPVFNCAASSADVHFPYRGGIPPQDPNKANVRSIMPHSHQDSQENWVLEDMDLE
jgi:hypothetical protein